ncbi:LacI family transcriptional regulator [Cryobacterium lactosi]|uniref:LacI family transcriptional regulator n=1 Tax=Cryobacterium lactosi TaxID=1259202 RepID=A0A4R9BZY3_9MICO|nr:LacI family DNA-binding transcriptional regulator [Cryobacterium lactosi]TFD94118.1 LacI family transcriptional regulator [Cryobacterium lactosi]
MNASASAQGKRPTVKDVAEIAGVSWATVSNVLHDHPNVRAATRARVEAAIEQLGYQPSSAGRELRGAPSRLLALAIPDIESPYFSHLAHAIISYAESLRYTVLINVTGGRINRERLAVRAYSERSVQGTIFSPLALELDEVEALRGGFPIVILGEHLREGRIDHVAIDNVTAAQELTDHLISTGRRRIAFMGYQPHSSAGTGDLRLQGYRQSLANAGIDLDDRFIIETDHYTHQEGEARSRQMIADGLDVDGIVCGNDLLAVGALRQFRLLGVRVPEDIALVGFDDTPDGRYCWPSLTTISPNKALIAKSAVDALIARIDDADRPPSQIVVPHSLIVRDSSATQIRDRVARGPSRVAETG